MMKKYSLVLLLLSDLFISGKGLVAQISLAESIKTALRDSEYIICVDGGGSKTELQVLDGRGNLVALKHNGLISDSVKAGGSNINVVGIDGVKSILAALFDNLKIAQTDIDLTSIAQRCAFVGGFSGAGIAESKSMIKSIIRNYNFAEEKIIVSDDAEMALESVVGDGIVLISGTGSICFGKKNGETFRVGGFGRLIGDEGSGYYMGIHALKLALEYEYGYGDATNLIPALKDYFKVSKLKDVIVPFYKGEITNYQIAAIAPIVFNQAEMNDKVSLYIAGKTARKLGKILACMIQMGNLSNCPIYFFGGVFKNKNAGQFIQEVLTSARIQASETFNRSQDNPTVFAVRVLQNSCN